MSGEAAGSRLKVLFAGGGTGGHVFPMLAVAEALLEQASAEVWFVGTARGLEATLVPERGHELQLLQVLPLRGAGLRGFGRGSLAAVRAVGAARRLLLLRRPDIVFSAGGYAAGPVALAARSLGIKVALMEPNSVVGLANRLMGPFVERVYTAFEQAERAFSPLVVLRAGVPLRSGFAPMAYEPPEPDAPCRVLVLGGSQGARSLNEAVPEALAEFGRPLEVLHQCGKDAEQVVLRYQAGGLGEAARVEPFIADMGGALAWSHLVISRAGASAVSEIAAVGRPSLLVPYPYAASDHQRLNAEAFERAGAAVCVRATEATAAGLRASLRALLGEPGRLGLMAQRARELGRPQAAKAIAQDLLMLVGEPRPRASRSKVVPEGGVGSGNGGAMALEAR